MSLKKDVFVVAPDLGLVIANTRFLLPEIVS
jgi:hypothetical protein